MSKKKDRNYLSFSKSSILSFQLSLINGVRAIKNASEVKSIRVITSLVYNPIPPVELLKSFS